MRKGIEFEVTAVDGTRLEAIVADRKPPAKARIVTLSRPPLVRECIQDMAQGRGGTGDDGKKGAKRHETAEQHECAESGFVGNHGVRERPRSDGGKDAQHESYQAPPIGTLRI